MIWVKDGMRHRLVNKPTPIKNIQSENLLYEALDQIERCRTSMCGPAEWERDESVKKRVQTMLDNLDAIITDFYKENTCTVSRNT
jgi:hypothetical protein